MADLKEFQRKMEKTLDVLASDFAAVRAGRANAQVLDRITVEYYGQPSPINQVGTVSSPDPRTLVIQPWDGSLLKAIEKAIQTSDLGINPQNDGRVIRLVFPPSRSANTPKTPRSPSATSAATRSITSRRPRRRAS